MSKVQVEWSGWRIGRRRGAVVAATLAALVGSASVVVIVDALQPDVEIARPKAIVEDATAGDSADHPSAVSSVPSVADSRLPDVEVHVNERAGYLFSYPTGWRIESQGGSDRLIDPAGLVLMIFDVASPGPLRLASDRFVGDITERYSDVELVRGSVERTPQGLPSLVVGGRAIAPSGETVRFLVITIHDAGGRNHTITVRFSGDADPPYALQVITEVVASYRISGAD